MNKKTIAVVMSVVGLILAGGASAALVNYLSNKVTATTSIASPVSMSINEGRNGSDSGNQTIAFSTFGGSSFTFTAVAKNNANNEVRGYRVIVLKSPTGKNFTGGEVVSVALENANVPSTDITATLKVIDNAAGTMVPLSTWVGDSQKLIVTNGETVGLDANEVDWNAITVKVNQAIAPGSYSIRSEFTNNLTVFSDSEF